jgi:hypothetical protein
MVVVGASNAVFDVAGFTLAQRTTPNRSRVAFLGLIDSLANGGVAAGGLAAPVLIAVLDVRGTLIATGVILPAVALALWPALRRLDESGSVDLRVAALVRSVPLFTPLSLATVEHLAEVLEPATFAPGEWVMREGEVGDRFVIVDEGAVEVLQGDRRLHVLGPGAGVGEIALLRDIPRTASVRALDEVRAWTLARADFLEAVTGSPTSLATATQLVDARLAGPDTRGIRGPEAS